MEKLICNASWGKTKTSRLARVVTLALVGAAGTTLSAHARQIVIPTLPMSPFADTEVSTNVVIHESRTDMRDVKIRLQLDGTPTNNLEIAFGCDENTNGVLDVSEIETVYGWRAGRYFIGRRQVSPSHRHPVAERQAFRAAKLCRDMRRGTGFRFSFNHASSGMALQERLEHGARSPARRGNAVRVGSVQHQAQLFRAQGEVTPCFHDFG